MNFDTPHRHDQALDPSALTTIAATLHAISQGVIDCRNAGVDPNSDPAVTLLVRHLTVVSTNHAPDEALHSACHRRLAAVRRFPALLALAIGGVGYDAAAKDRFHKDARKALRVLADELSLEPGSYDVASWCGDVSESGAVTLVTERLSVTVRIGVPYEGREVTFRAIAAGVEKPPKYAPMRALLDATALAARITGDLALAPDSRVLQLPLLTA